MKTEQLQMIFNYLDKIAKKIGTTAEQLWPVLVRQQYIDAIVSAVCFLGLLVITIVASRYMLKYWNTEEGYCIYKKNHEGFWISLLAVLGFLLIPALIYFVTLFPEIFNPQYWALKDLIQMAK
jgi:hypothetical protein